VLEAKGKKDPKTEVKRHRSKKSLKSEYLKSGPNYMKTRTKVSRIRWKGN
jgi:hypothetical protein